MSVSGRMMFLAVLMLSMGSIAHGVDTSATRERAPDLTTIRTQLKAKAYIPARDTLLELADTHDDADVFNLLGFALRKSGDYGKALTYYQKALDLDPEHKGAHEYLGELYAETGASIRRGSTCRFW